MHHSKKSLLLHLACAANIAATSLLAQQTGAGKIQGTVVTEAGNPVPNATVGARLVPGPSQTQFNTSTTTAGDGTFSVANLPAGTFEICVQVPGSALLNPCTWSVAQTVAVGAGQTASAGSIKLQKGYLLQVHLNDAGGLLRSNEGKHQGAHVLAGVWAPNGLFIPMKTRTNDANGRDLELAVPFATLFQLSVSSPYFNVTDSSGVAIDTAKGTSIPLQISTGAGPQVYMFHVTGVNSVPGRL